MNDFREFTLDMRRNEKNLFLYRDATSYQQLMGQIDTADSAFTKGREAYKMIIGGLGIQRIEFLLAGYRAALQRYPQQSQTQKVATRESIRALGHELTEISGELSREEQHVLAQATRSAALLLAVAFGIVVLMGVAGGLCLVRRVVRPLRELETGLRAIDEGQARALPLPSKDKEIQSFVASFNAMLKHMRQQQDQVKRNEKAAALGVLVSGVAHELNNPLSNISTSAQLMLEEGETGDVELKKLWLTQIDSETERARRILRRLLDSVRQPGKLHRHRMPLLDLVQSSLDLVNRHLPPRYSGLFGGIHQHRSRRGPRAYAPGIHEPRDLSLLLIAAPCPSTWPRVSCLVMKKGRLPARKRASLGYLKQPTGHAVSRRSRRAAGVGSGEVAACFAGA